MSEPEKKYFNSNDARFLIQHFNFSLFPLHGIVNGKCTCGDPDCANKGKHPATKDGFKSATNDIDKLIALWDKRKHLNVGIATGAISGIFVVDIDSAEGEADIEKLGQLPSTLSTYTGKGRHLFFKHPGRDIKIPTKRAVIGAKVDIRGDGGYVAGVGSNHASGKVYQWDNPLEDIAEAPQWLLDIAIEKEKPQPAQIVPQPLRLHISNEWSRADVEDMLKYISPDIRYDDWIKIGMAIQSEGFDFSLWEDWSSKTRNAEHRRANPESHWNSFKANNGISFGTLVKMAQDGGWKRSVTTPARAINQNNDKKEILQVPNQKTDCIEYVMAKDIKSTLQSTNFVQNLLGENQLSVVYGESNCGKTFFMTDLSFHVAMGKRWRDLRVDKGGVIYTALEGSYGLRNRVGAYRMKHGLNDALFAMVAAQIDFLNPKGNIGQFIDCIKRASDEMGSCKLVVIDTLARALGSGDENSGQDMGLLVHHADRIRYETGAHVSFIHHSGKDRAKGARGHSSLRAAVDTEIEISRLPDADYSIVNIAKQREMEALDDMYFKLERVVLSKNEFLEEIVSCVVNPYEINKKPKFSRANLPLTAAQNFAYDAIRNAIAVRGQRTYIQDIGEIFGITYEQFNESMAKMGWSEYDSEDKIKKATNNIRAGLRDKNKICFNSGFIWLPKQS